MKELFNKASFYVVTRIQSALGRELPYGTAKRVADQLDRTPAELTQFLQDNPGATGWDLGFQRRLLTVAAMNYKQEQVKPLLDAGSDINERDKILMTPLMWAAYEPVVLHLVGPREPKQVDAAQLETVRVLLAQGADPTLKNDRGETAAALSRTPEIRALLQAAERAWKPAAKVTGPRLSS